MITKTYKARSAVSIVVLTGRSARRVTFDKMSDGTSTYKTSDEALQKAMEGHRRYGKLFRLVRKVETRETAFPADAASSSQGTPVTEVTVTDAQSARQYMADTYGVSKTSMRSLAQLKAQAAAHNVEFIGI